MFFTSTKNGKHRNKPNRMSDAEIMLIMIFFIPVATDASIKKKPAIEVEFVNDGQLTLF